eukprot:1064698-Pyramimonas_sp.AAC.1
MQGPEHPEEVKRGGKKHSAKKDLKLKQTKKDYAHDDRAQLQVPASIQRHIDERKKAEETAAAPTTATEYQQGTTVSSSCLLYTSDAADDTPCVDL